MAGTGLRLTEAYVAGFLDADGSFGFYSGSPRVYASGVYPWVLDLLVAQYGGSIYFSRTRDGRPFYAWTIRGDAAMAVMAAIKDHLVVKRAQVLLIEAARCLPPGPQRDGIVAELSALKHQHH